MIGRKEFQDGVCVGGWGGASGRNDMVSLKVRGPNAWKRNRKGNVLEICVWSLSRVQLFVTSWNVDSQAPLSLGFSRQEYWSGLP